MSKFLMTAALLILTSTALAGSNSEMVYNALSVLEVNVTPPAMLGSTIFEKSVGGLVCQASQSIVLNSVRRYSCTLSLDEGRNDRDIYLALDVLEVDITPAGLLGASAFEKKVANLVCQKRLAVVPHPQPIYSCALN